MSDKLGKTILAMRDRAQRIRRLAYGLTAEADQQQLLQLAAEIDTNAADLERPTEGVALPPKVMQVQMQVQQQQAEASQAALPDNEKLEDQG